MDKKTARLAFAIVLSQMMLFPAFAESGQESAKPPLQISYRSGLNVVVQVNYADTIPNGISKQVLAAKNLYDQYEGLGMKAGRDFNLAIVFRADGAQSLLTDAAYDAKVRQPHPAGNPNKALIDEMISGGVKVYECAVAMRLKGYHPEDLLSYSRIVVSGIGALIDFEKSGYLSITP